MRILEIGPSYHPLVSKAEGWNAFTLDYDERQVLSHEYAHHVSTFDDVEEVDFVWRDGPIENAIPPNFYGTFDACVASHVIEHLPDPISFLNSLDRLLTPRGVISLVIPDKRFCFDFFRPVTLLPAWLEAFERKATRHSRRNVLEQRAYSIKNGDKTAWGQFHGLFPSIDNSIISAKQQTDKIPDEVYTDAHAWCFTPSSFDLLLLELQLLELSPFGTLKKFPTMDCEFFVTLSRQSKSAAEGSLSELLVKMTKELSDQASYLNGRNELQRLMARGRWLLDRITDIPTLKRRVRQLLSVKRSSK
jgi:SAM-dependent methyltransferase